MPAIDTGYFDGDTTMARIMKDDCIVMKADGVELDKHGGNGFYTWGPIVDTNGHDEDDDENYVHEVYSDDILGKVGPSGLAEAKRVLRRAGYRVVERQ